MKHASDPTGKGISLRRHAWRFGLTAGLCLCTLVVCFSAGSVSSPSASAATIFSSQRAFTVSPTQGPVGAVIVVSSSETFYPDGTQINVGYVSADGETCNVVSGGQAGVVHNRAFSSWFRWPTSTGKGRFGVCIDADGSQFQVGTYNVLSASLAQVAISPATPNAGKQATVSGANFLPAGTSVKLFWRSAHGGQSISLGTASSNSSGAFTHTFTVPSRASTGSYIITGTVGSGQPPTLSAAITFHVNGVTIVAMPTPTAQPSPTVAPTATATASATKTSQASSTEGKSDSGASKSGLILPIALGGSLLVALALIAGVLVVRKQRGLVAPAGGGFSWHGAPGPGAMAGGAYAPGPGASPYQMNGAPPPEGPGMGYAPVVRGPEAQPTLIMEQNSGGAAIPFDPGLAEAMREAQMSLFATPRPPVGAEVPS